MGAGERARRDDDERGNDQRQPHQACDERRPVDPDERGQENLIDRRREHPREADLHAVFDLRGERTSPRCGAYHARIATREATRPTAAARRTPGSSTRTPRLQRRRRRTVGASRFHDAGRTRGDYRQRSRPATGLERGHDEDRHGRNAGP